MVNRSTRSTLLICRVLLGRLAVPGRALYTWRNRGRWRARNSTAVSGRYRDTGPRRLCFRDRLCKVLDGKCQLVKIPSRSVKHSL